MVANRDPGVSREPKPGLSVAFPQDRKTRMQGQIAQELWWVTCADDLLDLHAGDVDLLGKLAHSLVGILIVAVRAAAKPRPW
ncbi:hypothetical protein EYF80_014212 [Liparis tanakae]|uniref:Uncharacterized protein n=1 Tax=Liparis tanakae TaxID=230148 RepID=A0A4Z2IC41_9TELE|nr:hypothetical protein EYF80_014212 [Liparis tanakae]